MVYDSQTSKLIVRAKVRHIQSFDANTSHSGFWTAVLSPDAVWQRRVGRSLNISRGPFRSHAINTFFLEQNPQNHNIAGDFSDLPTIVCHEHKHSR